jgi:hypothetical protein
MGSLAGSFTFFSGRALFRGFEPVFTDGNYNNNSNWLFYQGEQAFSKTINLFLICIFSFLLLLAMRGDRT